MSTGLKRFDFCVKCNTKLPEDNWPTVPGSGLVWFTVHVFMGRIGNEWMLIFPQPEKYITGTNMRKLMARACSKCFHEGGLKWFQMG